MVETAIKELSRFSVRELQMHGLVERVWRSQGKLIFAHLRVAGIRYRVCIPLFSDIETKACHLIGQPVWAVVECVRINEEKRYRLIHLKKQSIRACQTA